MTDSFLADDMVMRVWHTAAHPFAFFNGLLASDPDVVDWMINQTENLEGVTILHVVVKRSAMPGNAAEGIDPWLMRVMFRCEPIVRFRMVKVEEVAIDPDDNTRVKTGRGPTRENCHIDEEVVTIPPPGAPPMEGPPMEDPPEKLAPEFCGIDMVERLRHHLVHHAEFKPVLASAIMVELFAEAMTQALDNFEAETGHRGMITVVTRGGEIKERNGKPYLYVRDTPIQSAAYVQPQGGVWLVLSSPSTDGDDLRIAVLQTEPKGIELSKVR